jgi:hypothetical protein
MRAIAAAGESASVALGRQNAWEYPAPEVIRWMHSGRCHREDKKVKDRR